MRYLLALTVVVIACGGPRAKKETLGNDDTPVNCCCKTIPATAEKEITPVYASENRMECSTKQGQCVPDVQCNGSQAQSLVIDREQPRRSVVTPGSASPRSRSRRSERELEARLKQHRAIDELARVLFHGHGTTRNTTAHRSRHRLVR
jgi:hypothetical protein